MAQAVEHPTLEFSSGHDLKPGASHPHSQQNDLTLVRDPQSENKVSIVV